MRRATALALALILAGIQHAAALGSAEVLPDAGLEKRARAISSELRCVVCQNQSVDESDAPLARDLRSLVRERLVAGDSDGAVRRFVVDRYGEFVLLRPSFGWHTALLWIAPFVILAAGAIGLVMTWRGGRPSDDGSRPLSDGERDAIAALTKAGALPDATDQRPPRV